MKIRNAFLALAIACSGSIVLAKGKTKTLTFESTVLTFASDSHELGTAELEKLQQVVTSAKVKGKIVGAELAVWSDKNHPVTGELSKTDEKLASQRIEDVKHALKKDMGGFKFVKTYNMAENANWLGRHINSNESQLDELYAKKERGSMAREDLSLIKRDGAPSKAVVILKIRD